jgi:glycerol-3-phosphate dehydrogenase (NAD(P)+)
VDGLGYGINTKAALITRGLIEMKRIVSNLGGDETTLNGLVGIGDLIVTCTSNLSRNYSFGILIGEGKSFLEAESEIDMVVEGTKTCKSAFYLSKELNLQTPIIDSIYYILYEGALPEEEIERLMNRKLTEE